MAISFRNKWAYVDHARLREPASKHLEHFHVGQMRVVEAGRIDQDNPIPHRWMVSESVGRDSTCGRRELLLPIWSIILVFICTVVVADFLDELDIANIEQMEEKSLK